MQGAFLNRGFAFQAPAWGRCALHEVVLRKVFRQQSDQKFLRILQDIRRAPPPPCHSPAAHLMACSAVIAGCSACQSGSGESHARLCLLCVPMTTSFGTHESELSYS